MVPCIPPPASSLASHPKHHQCHFIPCLTSVQRACSVPGTLRATRAMQHTPSARLAQSSTRRARATQVAGSTSGVCGSFLKAQVPSGQGCRRRCDTAARKGRYTPSCRLPPPQARHRAIRVLVLQPNRSIKIAVHFNHLQARQQGSAGGELCYTTVGGNCRPPARRQAPPPNAEHAATTWPARPPPPRQRLWHPPRSRWPSPAGLFPAGQAGGDGVAGDVCLRSRREKHTSREAPSQRAAGLPAGTHPSH